MGLIRFGLLVRRAPLSAADPIRAFEALVARLKEREGMKSFVDMLKDGSGATAAEYGLIIALVGSAVALSSISLGSTIANALNGVSNTLAKCSGGNAC